MFKTRAFGKWILAGEHSVLRGSPAIVFPLFSRWLEFEFVANESAALELELEDSFGSEFRLLFWSVFEKACESLGVQKSRFRGKIRLKSNLQVGAGQGASASLCIVFARWFHSLNLIERSDIVTFARKMENIFHGESSGVDVAVVEAEKPLHFEREGKLYPLEIKWKPHFYLTYSGQKGMTYECVQKVKNLIETNPQLGNSLDFNMRSAALACEQALLVSQDEGFNQLCLAMTFAKDCFAAWGLITPEMKAVMDDLEARGAKAVKPTGSGGGGFILSLWEDPPEEDVNLIPCFVSN